MTNDQPSPPGPSEQHELLLAKVGEWNVACKYYMNPSDPPIEADGTDSVTSIGSYWTAGQFSCEMMGTHIRGLATTGYDPRKGKFVGTWQDSSNPYHYYFEGDLTEDGTLEMVGQNRDPMSGDLVTYRSVETIGADSRKLELFVEYSEDNVLKILEYDYTRA